MNKTLWTSLKLTLKNELIYDSAQGDGFENTDHRKGAVPNRKKSD